MSGPDLVILSGGAESVSVAVAEAAWRAGLSYAVVAITPHSIMGGLPGCVRFDSISGHDVESPSRSADWVLEKLTSIRGDSNEPLCVFPTEDDGLWLLNTLRNRLGGIAEFSRMRALDFGGLDKAETFNHLASAGLQHLVAPTIILRRPQDMYDAAQQLGESLVVKPSFKPWRRSVGPGGLKVIARGPREPLSSMQARLTEAWPFGEGWIAQQRLSPLGQGERSACVVRSDVMHGCEVVERRKYPRMGGSAIWVTSMRDRILTDVAETITSALALHGMCELSFLADGEGRPRLLELNTRPWLQLELVERSGYPIVAEALAALRGRGLGQADGLAREADWVHLERMAMSFLSGNGGPRMAFAMDIVQIMRSRPIVAVYGSSLPGVRRRWIGRNLRKALEVIWNGRWRRA